jgi:hypothetical protein
MPKPTTLVDQFTVAFIAALAVIGALLIAEIAMGAEFPELPTKAPVEVFATTVDEGGVNRNVQKKETKKLTRILNTFNTIDARAGNNETVEEIPVGPSFLVFTQFITDPTDHTAYQKVMVSIVFIDAVNEAHLMGNYTLDQKLSTPRDIRDATMDARQIIERDFGPYIEQYWREFKSARDAFFKELQKDKTYV